MQRVTKMHFLVLGDCGTGKTTLVQHFLHDRALSETLPTIAYDLAVKKIDDVNHGLLEFWVWDAAGDARWFQNQAQQQLYYKNKQAIVLLYDMTDLDSFTSVERLWLPRLRAANAQWSGNWRLCLVANKLDLGHRREVSTQEGRALAQEHRMHYMELSSLAGDYEAMRQPFLALAVELLDAGLVKPEPVERPTVTVLQQEKETKCC